MPCPHFDVKIIQRSKRQSAVASAAYQSGERLFSEYDQKQKYYSHKSEIVHTEIMLPPHAPSEYADRNTLWNAAEAIEKQWNSQLARRFVLAIPRELPPEQYADLIRDYCREFFVSKGMIADFAIHDKGDGNPHAHILLTMRAMDENGKWLPKSRKVYDLDENGKRMSGFSSCGILFSGTTQVSGQTIYTAEDRDIKGAEADYKKLEKELDKKIKRTPLDHPGYNEYQYHLDPIEHDPWQLTSFLTTLYDDYTRSEVQAKLQEIFKKQYKLTTWVEVQIRYKTVWVISPAGIPVPTQVPYEYKIFHTKLENKGLETVIREELDEDQWKRYKIFQETLGGRPYLFNGGLPPGGSDGSGESGIDYTVPAEALTDNEFAAIYEEAKKYVGTPYVWGGSSPETGFDCSGYICWIFNQNGYDVGRTTANGLWNKCQKISEAEAKPGDLVFFKGTYDTPGMSHVGLYLGNGMMVSAGDPIKYANIHSSYWEKYLAGFGRLSK